MATTFTAPAVAALRRLFGFNRTPGTQQDGTPINKGSAALDKALGTIDSTDASMVQSLLNQYLYGKLESDRRLLYKDYDQMDDESDVITTPLDMYAEDATDIDGFVGSRLWVTSDNDKIALECNNVLARLRIEKLLPRIARNVAKYGDFFLRLSYDKDPVKLKEQGLQRVDTSYHPGDLVPIVRDYRLLGYARLNMQGGLIAQPSPHDKEQTLYSPWDFVHFAVPGDSNFVTQTTQLYSPDRSRSDMVEYGQSLLKAARRPYRRSKLTHDILAISRITRSPLKRVFKFRTETDNPVKAITDLAIFKKTMEKVGGIDKLNENANYEELLNIMTKDIYIPIMKDGQGDYAFDTVGGDVDVANIVDVELFDNRFYMSLRIPKEFLNFDSSIGEKATLLLKDIRYSKRVKRLQGAVKAGIREMLQIHLALRGYYVPETQLTVNMASTSISEDLQRLDYYTTAIATADQLVRMLDAFQEGEGGEKLQRNYLVYYILKHVVKLPNFDLQAYFPEVPDYAADSDSDIPATDDQDTESDTDKETTQKSAEGNKSLPREAKLVLTNGILIEKLFNEKLNNKELSEAVAELNLHLEKEYKTENATPANFSYKELHEYVTSAIAAKDPLVEESK